MIILKVFRLVVGLGFTMLLFSAVLPWLNINFLGQHNVSISNIYGRMMDISSEPSYSDDPIETITSYLPSVWALIFSLLLFPIDVILSVISFAIKRVSVVAGFSSVITGLLWMAGIWSLKTQIATQIAKEGGSWGVLLADSISGIIGFSFGTYLTIVAGLVFLTAYFIPSIRITR